MPRKTQLVKFVLLMSLLIALAVFMGSDPWGPV